MRQNEHDALVEAIAAKVAEGSLLDLFGVLSKRKRDREDAALRMKVREEQRREIADLIRAFKRGSGLDPLVELQRVNDAGGSKEYDLYSDIADCASANYVDVQVVADLTSNSIPARCHFVATITKRGAEALQARINLQPAE